MTHNPTWPHESSQHHNLAYRSLHTIALHTTTANTTPLHSTPLETSPPHTTTPTTTPPHTRALESPSPHTAPDTTALNVPPKHTKAPEKNHIRTHHNPRTTYPHTTALIPTHPHNTAQQTTPPNTTTPPQLPMHQPGAPPTGEMWTWTEAHVGDPSQRAQGMAGYKYRTTARCGSPHNAVGTWTHNHRPAGDAGSAPTWGPHSTSFRRRTEHRTEPHITVYRRRQQTKPSNSPPPRRVRWIRCQHAA